MRSRAEIGIPGSNLGFARANNIGFQHAVGRFLLFLNPDTEVCEQALDRMYTALDSLKDAGALGCRLLNSDGSLQESCIQPFPTLLNQMLDIEYLKMLAPTLKLWGMAPLYQANSSPVPVEVVSGACLMIKRSVFQHVNNFSSDYFMYTEDIDLCFKVRQAGFKVYYLNDVEIVHHGGGSSRGKGSRFTDVLMRESVWTFIRKYQGALAASGYRLIMFLNASTRILLLKSLFFLDAVSAFNERKRTVSKWMNILRWSLGIEKWARNLNSGSACS